MDNVERNVLIAMNRVLNRLLEVGNKNKPKSDGLGDEVPDSEFQTGVERELSSLSILMQTIDLDSMFTCLPLLFTVVYNSVCLLVYATFTVYSFMATVHCCLLFGMFTGLQLPFTVYLFTATVHCYVLFSMFTCLRLLFTVYLFTATVHCLLVYSYCSLLFTIQYCWLRNTSTDVLNYRVTQWKVPPFSGFIRHK